MEPLVHRAAGMRCKTCIWFAPKRTLKPGTTELDPVYHLGPCRRHAPAVSGFPIVFVNDWCGDHQLNENCVAQLNENCVADQRIQPATPR